MGCRCTMYMYYVMGDGPGGWDGMGCERDPEVPYLNSITNHQSALLSRDQGTSRQGESCWLVCKAKYVVSQGGAER